MNEWQIASWVGGGLIALFGFTFTVFWSILKDMEKRVNDRIDILDSQRLELLKDMDKKLDDLKTEQASKPTYDYINNTFTRKDIHALEYAHILDSVLLLSRKFDDFVRIYLGDKK